MIFLSSCSHKDYITLIDEYKEGVYNKDKTQFSFFKFYRIYRPAKGLAAFPDGGQSKVLYEGVFVYLFDIQSGELSIVYSYEGLQGNQSAWYTRMYFDDKNQLFFNISPSGRYKSYYVASENIVYEKYKGLYLYSIDNKRIKEISKTVEVPLFSADGQRIIYTNYSSGESKIYMMDMNGENVKFRDKGFNPIFSPKGDYLAYIYESDSAMYNIKIMNFSDSNIVDVRSLRSVSRRSIYWLTDNCLGFKNDDRTHKKYNIGNKKISDSNETKSNANHNGISSTDIKKYTKDVTYTQWGIELQKYYPKSKKEILKSIVDTDKGNQRYRKALLQEIENELRHHT